MQPQSVHLSDSAHVLLSGADTLYLIDRQGAARRIVTNESEVVMSTKAVFSPDGSEAAYSRGNNMVVTRDLQKNTVINALSHDEQISNLFYSADGRCLIVQTIAAKVRIWNLRDHVIDQIRVSNPMNAFFLPGTAGIAAQDDEGAWQCAFPEKLCPSWLNDSIQYAVSWDGAGAVLLQDASGLLRRVNFLDGKVYDMPRLPLATLLPVTGGDRAALYIADTLKSEVKVLQSDGREFTSIALENKGVNALALSPDGQYLAFALTDSSAAVRAFSDTTVLTHRFYSPVQSVVFSPDGKRVLIGVSGLVYRWEPNSADATPFLLNQHQEDAPINAIAFSPDGRFIATAGGDQNIILWSQEGGWLHTFAVPGSFGAASFLQFSADGRYLLSRHFNDAVFRWPLAPETFIRGMQHAEKVPAKALKAYRLKGKNLLHF